MFELPPPAVPAPRRGRPRKWPDEATRRAHESAKRRLRNQAVLGTDDFEDRVALVAKLDQLQAAVTRLRRERTELLTREEVDALRQKDRKQIADLRHHIAVLKNSSPHRQSTPSPTPSMNRQQRRAATNGRQR